MPDASEAPVQARAKAASLSDHADFTTRRNAEGTKQGPGGRGEALLDVAWGF